MSWCQQPHYLDWRTWRVIGWSHQHTLHLAWKGKSVETSAASHDYKMSVSNYHISRQLPPGDRWSNWRWLHSPQHHWCTGPHHYEVEHSCRTKTPVPLWRDITLPFVESTSTWWVGLSHINKLIHLMLKKQQNWNTTPNCMPGEQNGWMSKTSTSHTHHLLPRKKRSTLFGAKYLTLLPLITVYLNILQQHAPVPQKQDKLSKDIFIYDESLSDWTHLGQLTGGRYSHCSVPPKNTVVLAFTDGGVGSMTDEFKGSGSTCSGVVDMYCMLMWLH